MDGDRVDSVEDNPKLPADATDTRITSVTARFRNPRLERRFQRSVLSQTRFMLVGFAVLGVLGALVSGYGTYLSFGLDSRVFRDGLLLRGPLLLLCLAAVGVFLVTRSSRRLYLWNALGLTLGCAAMALRTTVPPDAVPEALSPFHVSRDGVVLLLVAAMAELALVPAWFAVNAAIVSFALTAFLTLFYFDPAVENPLNLLLAAPIALAFILAMGNGAQRMRRQTFLVHTRLREANVRLKRLARTDPLTGCANRRRFFEVGEVEFDRSRRHRRPLVVVVMDLDDFKGVNDCYGHTVGDRVLAAVATAAGRELRATDLVGRIGGEEFAFLLPETDAESGGILAERLRRRIASTEVPIDQGSVSVTASFGVSDNAFEPPDFSSLFTRADTALFDAKRSGRNRIATGPGESR